MLIDFLVQHYWQEDHEQVDKIHNMHTGILFDESNCNLIADLVGEPLSTSPSAGTIDDTYVNFQI